MRRIIASVVVGAVVALCLLMLLQVKPRASEGRAAVNIVCDEAPGGSTSAIDAVIGVDADPPSTAGGITPLVTTCAQAENILRGEGFKLSKAFSYYPAFYMEIFLKGSSDERGESK